MVIAGVICMIVGLYTTIFEFVFFFLFITPDAWILVAQPFLEPFIYA
jgi:hypothetical protein